MSTDHCKHTSEDLSYKSILMIKYTTSFVQMQRFIPYVLGGESTGSSNRWLFSVPAYAKSFKNGYHMSTMEVF